MEKLRPGDEKASCLKSNNRDILKAFQSRFRVTFTVRTVLNTSLISLQLLEDLLGGEGSSELWRCRIVHLGVEGALANRSDGSTAVKISHHGLTPRNPCQFQVRHQTPGDPQKWRRLAGEEARPLTRLTKEKKRASPKIPSPANPSRREEPSEENNRNDARRTCFYEGPPGLETRGYGLAPARSRCLPRRQVPKMGGE